MAGHAFAGTVVGVREHAQSWGLRRLSGWDRLGIRSWPERSVPVPEGILERLVEHVDPDREKGLNGVAIPAHLLALDHPARHELVDGGFDKGSGDRGALATPLPIVRQGVGVRVERGRQLTEVRAQVLEP